MKEKRKCKKNARKIYLTFGKTGNIIIVDE